MARPGNRGDLLAAGLGLRPAREQFASEISEDATWVAAARDGDRAAFGRLYERYAHMVHGAWLAAIARNVANDYHRRSAPKTPLTDDVSDESQGGTSGGDHHGPAAAVLEALRSLPDAYRETLILRLVEGMTGPEIAARTGMTHGSVRVNLHRGMQQLRAK